MLDERKNVIESIANFKLQSADKPTSNAPAPTNAAGETVFTAAAQSTQTSASTTEAPKVVPVPANNSTTLYGKTKFVLLLTCLLLSVALLLVKVFYQPGFFDNATTQVETTASPITNNEAQFLSLKDEIQTLQQTMNGITKELQLLSTVQLSNSNKQQQVADFLTTNSSSNANNSENSNVVIDQSQREFQQQQQQQIVALEASIKTLQNDSISSSYGKKIERWQGDIDNIKSQQLKIHGLLLELQKEYIKLNQIQVNKTSADLAAVNKG